MVFCYVSKDYVYKTQAELSVFDESEQKDMRDLASGTGESARAFVHFSHYSVRFSID
jgi:hypothetical protein